MKIGVTGCSNSSTAWGHPWYDYVGVEYNAEIISSSSSGAGNEMNVDKMKYILENNDLDYFIVQVTEPARFVVGINNYTYDLPDGKINEWVGSLGLHGANRFEDLAYYTFNGHNNQDNLKRLFRKDFNVDDFFINHVFASNYNCKNKVFHTLLTMKQLCDMYNVKILFFSWFADLYELAESCGYSDIIKNLDICEGVVFDYTKQNNITPLQDGHFGSKGHEGIFQGFLKPFLDKHLRPI